MAVDRGMMDRVGFDETMEFTADGICVMTIYDHGEAMEESRDTYEGHAPGVLLVNGIYLEHYTVGEYFKIIFLTCRGDKICSACSGRIIPGH